MSQAIGKSFNQKLALVVAAVFAIVVGQVFWSIVAPGSNSGGIIRDANASIAFGKDGETLCFPDVHGSGDIHSVYFYGGGNRLDPDSSKSPRVVEVEVRPTKKPVLLALSGYNSIAWRIKAHEGAKIAGIWASGYHEPVVLDVPEGVSVGKTYLDAEWSGDNNCVLTDRMKRVKAKHEARRENARPSTEDRIAGRKPFRLDYYYRLDSAHSRKAFSEVISSLGNFEFAGTSSSNDDTSTKSYVVSDKKASDFKQRVDQARRDVAHYENPSNWPELDMISVSAPVHHYREAEGALKRAIKEGYLKKGGREFEYYCKYKAALQQLNGGSGKHACQFHVNHKYPKAYTVLGNFEFPPKTCFPQSTVILLPPGIHKPNVRHCSGDRHAILYLRLFIKPCLQGRSKCDRIESRRAQQAHEERKKKKKS